MAHRFIVGETPREATGVLEDLWTHGVATSVDLLGEATVTTAEADRYAARCREALDGLVEVYRKLPERPSLEADSAGRIPRENLSVKVSALTPLLRADAPELGKRDAAVRLRDLLRRARELDAHLHIDMESFDSREAVTDLVLELLSEDEFRDGPSAGLVLQAYLRDSPQLCERVIDWAQSTPRGYPAARAPGQGRLLGPRGRRGPPARLAVPGLRGQGRLRPQLRGAHAAPARGAAGGPRRDRLRTTCARSPTPSPPAGPWGATTATSRCQVLRGLGDDLQEALAKRGLRVRTYCPVGDLVAGMAYLVRRLLENTSNESFLHEQAAGRSLDELLAAP